MASFSHPDFPADPNSPRTGEQLPVYEYSNNYLYCSLSDLSSVLWFTGMGLPQQQLGYVAPSITAASTSALYRLAYFLRLTVIII